MFWADRDMRTDRLSPLAVNGQSPWDHRSGGDAAASAAKDDPPPAESVEPDALKLLLQQFRELGEYFSYYAAAKADILKLSVRNTVLCGFIAALGFVAASGLFLTAGWLLLIGFAEGVGVLFGDRTWVGNLLTGGLLLAGLAGLMYVMVVAGTRAARERTVTEYAKRQTRQETRYGRTVSERAAAAGSNRQ